MILSEIVVSCDIVVNILLSLSVFLSSQVKTIFTEGALSKVYRTLGLFPLSHQ